MKEIEQKNGERNTTVKAEREKTGKFKEEKAIVA